MIEVALVSFAVAFAVYGISMLVVHHSARYAGTRMSRQSAWAVVDAGQPLDVVQDYLGHRSVETTRAYYAHTREDRVDEALHQAPIA